MKYIKYTNSCTQKGDNVSLIAPLHNTIRVISSDVNERKVSVVVSKPGNGAAVTSLDYIAKTVSSSGAEDCAVAVKQITEALLGRGDGVHNFLDLPAIQGTWLKTFDIDTVTTLALDEDVVVTVGTTAANRPNTVDVNVWLVGVDNAGEENEALNWDKTLVQSLSFDGTAADLERTFAAADVAAVFSADDDFAVYVQATCETNKTGRVVVSDPYTFIATNP